MALYPISISSLLCFLACSHFFPGTDKANPGKDRIVVVHVGNTKEAADEIALGDIVVHGNSLLDACQTIFYRFGFSSVDLLFVPGSDVGEAILETAKANRVDFILLGRRGSRAEETELGSVSQYVLKNATVPVVLTDEDYTSPNENSKTVISTTYRVPNWGPVLAKCRQGQVGKLTSHDFSLEETSRVFELANKIKNNNSLPSYKSDKEAIEALSECRRCLRERKMNKFHKLADPNLEKLSVILRGDHKSACEKEVPHHPQGLEEISVNLSTPYPLYAVPSTQGYHSEFKHVLVRIPISTIISPNELVIVDTKTPMTKCLTVLSNLWVQHALVRNSKGKIIGFVSANDIINYWMTHFFLSSEELNLAQIEQCLVGNLKSIFFFLFHILPHEN